MKLWMDPSLASPHRPGPVQCQRRGAASGWFASEAKKPSGAMTVCIGCPATAGQCGWKHLLVNPSGAASPRHHARTRNNTEKIQRRSYLPVELHSLGGLVEAELAALDDNLLQQSGKSSRFGLPSSPA